MEISSNKYRVGIPPVRPLSLENSHDVSDVCSPDVLDELYEKVAGILRTYEIDFTDPLDEIAMLDGRVYRAWEDDDESEPSISLVYRSYPDVPESARLTLLVIADWTNSPEAWELAVQAIRPLVLKYLPNQQEVDVEMIDGNLADIQSFRLVDSACRAAHNWEGMSSQILDVLQNNPASRGTLVLATLARVGRSRSIENPVIVYVSVTEDCARADWPPIIADIKKIIEPQKLELMFEHDEWEEMVHYG